MITKLLPCCFDSSLRITITKSFSISTIFTLIAIIADLEYVRELVGHVHCHGAHPEEETDERVLAAVAEKYAESTHVRQLE